MLQSVSHDKNTLTAAFHSFKAMLLITEIVLVSFMILTSIFPFGYKIFVRKAYSATLTRRKIVQVNASLGELRNK